jgi:Arc/MetJ-type ribon-helix-helix transcriptional regulator
MERVRIKARERSGKKLAALREVSQDITPAARDTSESQGFNHSITVRYGTMLYDTIQNAVESAHATQDFTFVSPSDFVRAALKAYKEGMSLTELDIPGAKRETKLRVDDELYQFYQELPKGMRSRLLERAIRTYIKVL